ncbi:MAG: PQQ-binding-like beta-propeller repeat protein [Capsulimonadales bacterium]|nr:PQQ-binding-like beta-propeller repeat protein [Capsulimonadales bacterium]
MQRSFSSHSFLRGLLPCLTAVLVAPASVAEDWPQWRGVNRDALSKEKGLLSAWPESGPRLLWVGRNLGEGHSTPSVAKGRIYGMGLRGSDEVVWALDARTGKELWATKIADGITLEAAQGGYGSRSTPTVDGDHLYTLGVGGDLVCMSVANGKLLWKKNLVRDFNGDVPRWGYSESPLVDGEKVVVTPGGDAFTVVALNKKTGETIWKSQVTGGNGATYSSPILATVGGVRQYIQFLTGAVVGVDAASGKFLWRFDAPACRQGINCSTPIYTDSYVFAASAYGHGGGLAKLTGSGGATTAEQVYFTKQMQNHHGGMVVVGDYLYGFDNNTLTCLEFKTGKLMWADRSVGKGSVAYADGNLYVRGEQGPVALVATDPKAYTEKGRFAQPERSNAPAWPHPVIANGTLLLRDQGNLFCYAIK